MVSATHGLFSMRGDWPDVTPRSFPLIRDLSDMVGLFRVQRAARALLLGSLRHVLILWLFLLYSTNSMRL